MLHSQSGGGRGSDAARETGQVGGRYLLVWEEHGAVSADQSVEHVV